MDGRYLGPWTDRRDPIPELGVPRDPPPSPCDSIPGPLRFPYLPCRLGSVQDYPFIFSQNVVRNLKPTQVFSDSLSTNKIIV